MIPARHRSRRLALSGPTIYGVGYVGYMLFCDSIGPYQWLRNGAPIAGAFGPTYFVTLADEGVPIQCLANGRLSNIIEQWVPSDASSSPETWYDAYDASTITIATGVSSWSDKGSIPRTAIQATGSAQPVYSATGLSGHPAITFESGKSLVSAVSAGVARNISNYLIAWIARPSNTGTTQRIITHSTTSSNSARVLCRINASQTILSGRRRLDGDAFQEVTAGGSASTDPVICVNSFRYSSAESGGRINGATSETLASTGTSGFTSDTASAVCQIGVSPGAGSEYLRGPLSEVLCFALEPTQALADNLAGYLAWRWRQTEILNVSNPYKSRPPTPLG
jgi:hypothetical protein